jgi:hypothetical protein
MAARKQAARKKDERLLVARESFEADVDGKSIVVHKGVTRVRASHPLVRGRELLFEPLDEHRDRPDVEEAIAEPGRKRHARR